MAKLETQGSNCHQLQSAKYKTANSISAVDAEDFKIEKLQSTSPRRKYASAEASMRFEMFNTHTPPDILAKTRIISVLGITDSTASPDSDGWMLGDFFAFWNLFHSIADNQNWYHCTNLKALVDQFGHYSKEGTDQKSKVVLDGAFLEQVKHMRHRTKQVEATELKEVFTNTVRNEFLAAQKSGEDVLILMFAHGDLYNQGLQLGKESCGPLGDDDLLLKPTDNTLYRYNNRWVEVGNWMYRFRELRNAMEGFSGTATVMTTNPWGGGWVCRRFDMKNASTTPPPSTGLACNILAKCSIFAHMMKDPRPRRISGTPVYETATSNTDGEHEDRESLIMERNDLVEELAEVLHDILIENVDEKGLKHSLSFEVDKDAYLICHRERRGISLRTLQARWDKLEDVTKAASVSPPDGVRGKTGRTDDDTLYGGTSNGWTNMFSNLAQQLLNSDKRSPFSEEQEWLHYHYEGFRQPGRCFENYIRTLQYCMHQMAAADSYLEIMGVPPPRGLQCCDMDLREIKKDKEVNHTIREMYRPIFDRPPIFREQCNQLGLHFFKGYDYICIAFLEARLSKEEIIEKLDVLVKVLRRGFKQNKKWVLQNPKVRILRRKIYHIYGALEGMSAGQREEFELD